MTDLDATVGICILLIRYWYTDDAQHTLHDYGRIVRQVTLLLGKDESAERTLLEADAIRELQKRLGT